MFGISFSHVRAGLKYQRKSFNKLSAGCALFFLGTLGAMAQEPATSLDELKLILGKSDRVTLVDVSGKSTAGRIERIAPGAVELEVGGKVLNFSEKNIRQITQRKHDSVLNGVLIGAGVGMGATSPLNLALAERDEKHLAVAASAIWGLIGGGIGAIVDACLTQKQMVYFHPKSKVAWSIHPFYSIFQKPAAGAFLTPAQRYPGIDPNKGLAVTLRF